MTDNEKQRQHYDEMMSKQRPTKGLSCGYDSRFDPFLLDKRPELGEEYNHLFDSTFPQKVGKLLDIGCGSGLYFPTLQNRAGQITGIDISEGMLDAAQELVDAKGYDNFTLLQGSAEELPFEDNQFDAVLGFDVLHHIPDVHKALDEVHRVLKPGGLIVSVEPNVLNPIVFMIHALPKEERGALRYNYPWSINSLIKKRFGNITSTYVNHVTAPNSKIILAGVRAVNFITGLWPFKYLSIRMIWSARKPQ